MRMLKCLLTCVRASWHDIRGRESIHQSTEQSEWLSHNSSTEIVKILNHQPVLLGWMPTLKSFKNMTEIKPLKICNISLQTWRIYSKNVSIGPWHVPLDSIHFNRQPKALNMHTGRQMHENQQWERYWLATVATMLQNKQPQYLNDLQKQTFIFLA